MQRFEYRRRIADSRENQMEGPDGMKKPIGAALDEWGNAGWELVSMATQIDTRSVTNSGFAGPTSPRQFVRTVAEVYVFKRSIE
jgi:hypothetical protein